jgi:DNA-directed RNA polymerase subunit RPC12/RpoP
MLTRKKTCKRPTCGVKTIHTLTLNDDGHRVWVCGNCGHETLVRPRKAAHGAR